MSSCLIQEGRRFVADESSGPFGRKAARADGTSEINMKLPTIGRDTVHEHCIGCADSPMSFGLLQLSVLPLGETLGDEVR